MTGVWVLLGVACWVVVIVAIVLIVYIGHGPGRGADRNRWPR